jgi:hypothetical protein
MHRQGQCRDDSLVEVDTLHGHNSHVIPVMHALEILPTSDSVLRQSQARDSC